MSGMEPISFIASTLGVVYGTTTVTRRWQALLAKTLLPEDQQRYTQSVERFQMANNLLSAVSHNLPTNKLPDGATQSLLSCQASLSSTDRLVSEIETLLKPGPPKNRLKALKLLDGLPGHVDHFISSVDLFRAFCQESQNRHIIESTENIRAELQNLQLEIARFNHGVDVTDEDARLASLHLAVKKLQPLQTTYQFSNTDEYVFTITIVSGAAPAVAQLTLDSGCDDNWVSLPLLQKAGLDSLVEDTGDALLENVCQTFSGHVMRAQGTIKLAWVTSHTGSRRTHENTFHVYDQLPVDMVVGKEFMGQEYVLVEKFALGKIKLGQLTDGEFLNLQASVKKKGVENSKIIDMRRAHDAAKRQARRAQNAASRATTGGANTPVYPSSGLRTPVSSSSRRLSVETSTSWSTSRAPSDPEATGSAVESSRGDSLGTSSTADDPVPQTEECLSGPSSTRGS